MHLGNIWLKHTFNGVLVHSQCRQCAAHQRCIRERRYGGIILHHQRSRGIIREIDVITQFGTSQCQCVARKTFRYNYKAHYLALLHIINSLAITVEMICHIHTVKRVECAHYITRCGRSVKVNYCAGHTGCHSLVEQCYKKHCGKEWHSYHAAQIHGPPHYIAYASQERLLKYVDY